MFVCKVLIVCCRGQPLPMAAIEVADVRVGSLLVFRCVDDSCHRPFHSTACTHPMSGASGAVVLFSDFARCGLFSHPVFVPLPH